MSCNRRLFFKLLTGAGAGAACGVRAAAPPGSAEQAGVLVDTTLCVGCRKCEAACNEINTDLPRQSPDALKDESVFARRRRMDAGSYTVVNRYLNEDDPGRPLFAKFQCMHCLKPACVSACIVGALSKESNGAVSYDARKCIGCRYCMVACPFQVPAYEYHNTLTPKVRKCTFCFEKRLAQGGLPACVQACPMQVMTFGNRTQLIRQAEETIRREPRRYVSHVYGKHEVGGTSWMYLSRVPFETIDFPLLGYHPVPGFTEPVQHLLFKWFLPPLGLYAALGVLMHFVEGRAKKREQASPQESPS